MMKTDWNYLIYPFLKRKRSDTNQFCNVTGDLQTTSSERGCKNRDFFLFKLEGACASTGLCVYVSSHNYGVMIGPYRPKSGSSKLFGTWAKMLGLRNTYYLQARQILQTRKTQAGKKHSRPTIQLQHGNVLKNGYAWSGWKNIVGLR